MAALNQMRTLYLPKKFAAQMRRHVRREMPREACGLLAGKNNRVGMIFEITNAEQSRVRYRMDAREQFDAFMRIESLEQNLLGIYHSHPNGPAALSPTDIAQAAYAVAHLLWFYEAGQWRLRAFWIEPDGRVLDVDLLIA